MPGDFLLQTGLIVAAAGGLAVLLAGARHRRHREHLERIAVRHSMHRVEGKCPSELLDKAGRYQRKNCKVAVTDLLTGDSEGRTTFLARRKVGRRSHQLLFLELAGSSRLDGFCVRPETRSGQEELSLQWQAPQSQWNDERALSMAARVMYNLSRIGDRDGATRLGLEIKGRRVWIHSRGALRGEALDRFVDDAMRLRHLLLKSLERANDVGGQSARHRAVDRSAASRVVHT